MQDVMFVKFHIHFLGFQDIFFGVVTEGGGGGHPDLEIGDGAGGGGY